ncbi:MAG TPA: ATP-binding protein [Chitinophagaceae bacterium]|nr:ATP-binding protein [Chitinophagaceae bacterium]HAN38121.1 ATP-binding protein [Chitinophagaceae bacterium]
MRITAKYLLQQIKADLIGKDAHRGVTLTYAWLANQFGHFALGFIPTFILNRIFIYCKVQHPASWAATIIYAFWLLFEIYNLLAPILLKKSTGKLKLNRTGKYTFKPAWKHIFFDTSTDIVFFWIGTTACLALLNNYTNSFWILLLLVTLLLLVAYPSVYWYRNKLYLQVAQFPFQLRLSQWHFPIAPEHKHTVNQFLQRTTKGNVLLVFGHANSGRTSLAVAIATELAIQEQLAHYTTYIKWQERINQAENVATSTLQQWRNANVLVVDDINADTTYQPTLHTAQSFYEILQRSMYAEQNKLALQQCNSIWVIGTTNGSSEEWQQMFNKLLGTQITIEIITLNTNTNQR